MPKREQPSPSPSDARASLAGDVFIHPLALIAGPNVIIGEGSVIGPYAVIYDNTRIGAYTYIGPHTVIGEIPPNGKPAVAPTLIGDFAQIGANVVIQSGAVVYDRAIIPHGDVLIPRPSLVDRLRRWRRRKYGWQKV
ncbi:MAG: hypothetical protein ACPL7K_02835 [Armatimonadota bacterium]